MLPTINLKIVNNQKTTMETMVVGSLILEAEVVDLVMEVNLAMEAEPLG